MQRQWVLVLAVVLAGLSTFFVQRYHSAPPAEGAPITTASVADVRGQQTEFMFCHWNLENFFDDHDDGRKGPGDKEYDGWFASHPDILKLKLDKISDALLKMNDGKGPDILAVVEVESLRAAQLLQAHLNARLRDPALHYQNLLMKEVSSGRHIAPAILTRLPVVRDRTRALGSRQRILEGRVVVNGHELIIVASHWTSRLKETGERGRSEYADKIYGECNAIFHSTPAADFLVAGDFNDDPDDESVVKHLHAIGDLKAVRASNSLMMLDLMSNKPPTEYGTLYYKKWHIFDQIAISPGLLDNRGWTCEPNSVRVGNQLYRPGDKQKRPWHFGGANQKGERGYSDHFPVTVRLSVERRPI